MRSFAKIFAFSLVLMFLASLAILQPFVKGESNSTSPPAIQWQLRYGNYRTESVSNVIQTIDGGYAFLDLGWTHGFTLQPAILYKLDSSGNTQWKKTIDFFIGENLIQTNDGGYEISGEWNTYGTTYETTPTILKTDSQGNIQGYENNTNSVSYLKANYSTTPTSDGGQAYLQFNSIVKIDSNKNVQWLENLTFPPLIGSTPPLGYYSSIIETRDGALLAIGVGTIAQSWEGYIYLIKTEAFLPLPSPTKLPTPLPIPSTNVSKPVLPTQIILFGLIAILTVCLSVGLIIYRKYRKTG